MPHIEEIVFEIAKINSDNSDAKVQFQTFVSLGGNIYNRNILKDRNRC